MILLRGNYIRHIRALEKQLAARESVAEMLWDASQELAEKKDRIKELEQALRDRGCPDGGTCHHSCEARCFRVECCVPLSNVFVKDEWPQK